MYRHLPRRERPYFWKYPGLALLGVALYLAFLAGLLREWAG